MMDNAFMQTTVKKITLKLKLKGKLKGFTLIELVAAIAVLAILAAIALPKFVNFGRSGRVSSINALASTLNTAAMMWHSRCLVETYCANVSGFVYLYENGKSYLMNNGYPEAGDVIGGDQIDMMISHSGYSISLVNNLTTKFSIASAPVPANCAVSYTQAANLNTPPVVASVISGC